MGGKMAQNMRKRGKFWGIIGAYALQGIFFVRTGNRIALGHDFDAACSMVFVIQLRLLFRSGGEGVVWLLKYGEMSNKVHRQKTWHVVLLALS